MSTLAELPQAPTPESEDRARFVAAWKPTSEQNQNTEGFESGLISIEMVSPHVSRDASDGIWGNVDITNNDRGLVMAHIGYVRLSPDHRGQGLGEDLYRAFTRIAMQKGATHMGGSVSPDSFRMRRKIFGDNSTRYYLDGSNDDVMDTSREISLEEAEVIVKNMQIQRDFLSQLAQKYGLDLEDQNGPLLVDFMNENEREESRRIASQVKGISALTDLNGLDTSTWAPEISPPES